MSLNEPQGIESFLAEAGWSGAQIEPLAGDASFRRYFRIRRGDRTAMLMDAPPPQEDPTPFLRVARWLDGNGMRAPRIYAEDTARGLVLLEDFGEVRMRDYLDQWPDDEREIYSAAVDTLVELHQLPAGPFNDYTVSEYLREARLLIDWYCPAQKLAVDSVAYSNAWEQVLAPILSRQRPGVTVLRDYHAEISARGYRYLRPDVERRDWTEAEMTVIDPFGAITTRTRWLAEPVRPRAAGG